MKTGKGNNTPQQAITTGAGTILRLITWSLACLPVMAGFAQEKKVVIKADPAPVISLQGTQRQPAVNPAPGGESAGNAGFSFRYAAHTALPGVVHILCTYQPNIKKSLKPDSKLRSEDIWNSSYRPEGEVVGSASGVLLSDDGYIVTNYHVVKGTRSLDAILYDHSIYRAEIVGTDSMTDLAVLKIESERLLPFVKAGRTDSLEEGDWVLAIGNPLNLPSTVTAGIISARSRFVRTLDGKSGKYAFIQTDAVTNDGSSGGALINMQGELIGLSTGNFTRDGNYSGYSFSIPAEIVVKVSNDLIRYGRNRRSYLAAHLLEMPQVRGAYIGALAKNGAAAKAGMQKGDIITAFAGRPVTTVETLNHELMLHHPGDQVTLTLERNGITYSHAVVLDAQDYTASGAALGMDLLFRQLGIEVAEVFEKEKTQLHLNGGLRVVSLNNGAIDQCTGIEPGFIITEVNNLPVTSQEDLFNILKNFKGRVLIAGMYPDYPRTLIYAAFNL